MMPPALARQQERKRARMSRSSRNRADRLTAKALALALRHPWDRHAAEMVLAAVAGTDRRAVQDARARIRRALDERPSVVGQRAVEALDAVLLSMSVG